VNCATNNASASSSTSERGLTDGIPAAAAAEELELLTEGNDDDEATAAAAATADEVRSIVIGRGGTVVVVVLSPLTDVVAKLSHNSPTPTRSTSCGDV